jgi:hypothetical protein
MNPNAPAMLVSLAGGLALALVFELFGAKVKFAKEHGTLTLLLGAAIFAAAGYAAVLYVHEGDAWILILMPFFIIAKIKESRAKTRRRKEAEKAAIAAVEAALAAREGDEDVEIDVTGMPSSVYWYVVNTNQTKGLKVESIKDIKSGKTRLRLSGGAQR